MGDSDDRSPQRHRDTQNQHSDPNTTPGGRSRSFHDSPVPLCPWWKGLYFRRQVWPASDVVQVCRSEVLTIPFCRSEKSTRVMSAISFSPFVCRTIRAQCWPESDEWYKDPDFPPTQISLPTAESVRN